MSPRRQHLASLPLVGHKRLRYSPTALRKPARFEWEGTAIATISLNVAQDPNTSASLSLADTLARATFGDPVEQMRAKALASEVGLRMASRDKAIADTGFVQAKTKTEQDAEDAILKAGPAIGDASAAAVPMPVPVEASRPGLDAGGYGPQPGIVSPHDQAVHDTLVAREKALGPLLARGTPEQVAQGVGKDYGGAILAAAAGNPAIVSGDSLRIAGGLYSGSAPTTSTVWSAGDTSGVDAEAREKILEARGTPQKPEFKDVGGGLVLPTLQPDGTYKAVPVQGAEPRPPKPDVHDYRGQPGIVALDGNGNPIFTPAQGTAPTPEKPDIVDLPGGGKGTLILDAQGRAIGVTPLPGAESRPEKQEIVDLPGGGKGVVTRDANGKAINLTPIPGGEAGPTPPYQGKTAKDDALNRIAQIQQKLANKQPISEQDAGLYESDYNLAYGPTNTKTVDPGTGRPLSYSVSPSIPFNTPSVNDVRRAANLPPAPVVAQNDEFTPRVTPEQDKARSFANAAAQAETHLTTMTPKDIPDVISAHIMTNNNGSFLTDVLQSNVDDKTKLWAQTMLQFTNAINRKESGAAITDEEWRTARQLYIPTPNDKAPELKRKYAARVQKIQDIANEGFRSDPKALDQFTQKWTSQGAGLDGKAPVGGGSAPRPSGGNLPAPNGFDPKVWSHLSQEEQQQYLDAK